MTDEPARPMRLSGEAAAGVNRAPWTPGVDRDPPAVDQELRDIGEGFGGKAFADFIGLWRDGPGVTRLKIRPAVLNGGGILIGPVGFALVDYSMASALWSHRNPGEHIATINISLNFIAGATDGELVCRSTLDRRNRHIAVLSSEVHHQDGRLLMTAVGSFSIYIPRDRRPASDPTRGQPG
jgi:acyl-coenzyme A thioesterase PaaI-like protein